MANKICGIYCIENNINNKKYIGQSINIYYRWTYHIWCLNNNCHCNKYLQRAWNKYGEENFIFEIIEECDINFIDKKEEYYINFYNTLTNLNGYNLDSGGSKNKRHSEETKRKMSLARKGKIMSNESRLKLSKNRMGKMTGKNHFMYGKHLSLETKQKLSKAITGMFVYEKHFNAIKVICINTNNIFNTIKEAGEYYNTDPVNISKCCKGERNYSGTLEDGTQLQWDYYEEGKIYSPKEYHRKYNNKPINQYDLTDNYIATYKSAREAEKETGIGYKMISRVCKGERPHTHGYIFKFI